MPTQPSAYAVKTLAQRAEDYRRASASNRGLFKPAGGQGAGKDLYDLSNWLSDAGIERFEEFLINGNGWFEVDGAASTWVSRFGYWVQNGQGGLAIQFHDGATCWYPSLAFFWFGAMRQAASKGKFIHEYIYKKVGYQLV